MPAGKRSFNGCGNPLARSGVAMEAIEQLQKLAADLLDFRNTSSPIRIDHGFYRIVFRCPA